MPGAHGAVENMWRRCMKYGKNGAWLRGAEPEARALNTRRVNELRPFSADTPIEE